MFFDMGPYMVWVRGYMLKLEVMDHALGVLANHHSSVMELETRFLLSCVLDHQPGDHGTSASGTSVGRGYGSFGVRVIRSIKYHMAMRQGLIFICAST
ncbi:unnamed protein product [Lactuca virosa]|uniref:Uncharacterized protein n=1 Tax=Lactuca virosa TaxID=75947 RepID=A0AAU9LF56_9ASTR|nr:unnamed protein product [Lactuca virosa]